VRLLGRGPIESRAKAPALVSVTICAFCSAVLARRRPDPVQISTRRTGSGLDSGKSSVSDMFPNPRDSGRTIAHQHSPLKMRLKDRLRLHAIWPLSFAL
jgi:hypothetical protein